MENNGVLLQRCNAVLCHLASPMSIKLLVNIYFLDSNMFQLENFHLKRSQPHSCFCFNPIGTCILHCFGHACDVLSFFQPDGSTKNPWTKTSMCFWVQLVVLNPSWQIVVFLFVFFFQGSFNGTHFGEIKLDANVW